MTDEQPKRYMHLDDQEFLVKSRSLLMKYLTKRAEPGIAMAILCEHIGMLQATLIDMGVSADALIPIVENNMRFGYKTQKAKNADTQKRLNEIYTGEKPQE